MDSVSAKWGSMRTMKINAFNVGKAASFVCQKPNVLPVLLTHSLLEMVNANVSLGHSLMNQLELCSVENVMLDVLHVSLLRSAPFARMASP